MNRMSGWAWLGVGISVLWLLGLVVVMGNGHLDRTTRDLYGLFPLLAIFGALALLGVLAWIEERVNRWRRR